MLNQTWPPNTLPDRLSGRVIKGSLRAAALLVAAVFLIDQIHAQETVTAKHSEQSVEEAKPDKHCSGAYHAALGAIKEGRSAELKQTLKAVLARLRPLPGRWRFPPRKARRDKSVVRLLNRAGSVVRARGRDLRLRRLIDNQALRRVEIDLRLYVSQPYKQALCTGAGAYMGIIEKKLELFNGKADQVGDELESALQRADWALFQVENDYLLTGYEHRFLEHRAVSLPKNDIVRLLQQARSIWRGILAGEDDRNAILSHVEMLTAMRSDYKALRLTKDRRLRAFAGALHEAFTLVEAAAYVQSGYSRYAGVEDAFAQTIAAVRNAHATDCQCDRPISVELE